MLLAILFLKFFIEALFDKIKPAFGHNTGVIIVVGIVASFIIYKFTEDKTLLKDLRFSEKLFFDVILPCIVFPSGYNMRRKKFFRNISTIMKFGFFATLLCFAIYSAMLYGVHSAGLITKFDKEKNAQVPLELDMF
jgi:NhaP-type Na+/H+ or K+/H+ antiporter